MIEAFPFQMVLAVLIGWLNRQERQAISYLMEENRVLRRQQGRRRLQHTDVLDDFRAMPCSFRDPRFRRPTRWRSVHGVLTR